MADAPLEPRVNPIPPTGAGTGSDPASPPGRDIGPDRDTDPERAVRADRDTDPGADTRPGAEAGRVAGRTDTAPAAATDLRWMRVALDASTEAFERGDWPTGAVLVRDGRLLATGQNRQETQRDITVHAEVDAIRAALAAHGPGATVGATLYCTMEPCPMCAGALKLAGVTRLVLALRHRTLRRTDLGRYDIESFCEMTGWHPALTEGVLEQDYLALRRRWGRDAVTPAADAPADADPTPAHRR